MFAVVFSILVSGIVREYRKHESFQHENVGQVCGILQVSIVEPSEKTIENILLDLRFWSRIRVAKGLEAEVWINQVR